MVYRLGYNPASSIYRVAGLEKLGAYSFEIGPIRPPTEAYSLLIRATRNCSWNRCEFCPVYKGQRFQLRPIEEIKKDIETAKAISDEIKVVAWRMGYGGRAREVAAIVHDNLRNNPSVQNVALWLYGGGKFAFLQDANTLIMRTPDLVQVLTFLKEAFPNLERITSYARSKTCAKKSAEELKEFYNAGLSRVHVGLESGCDEVLSFMQKGVTAEEHIKGGRRVVESGISLCEYVMPGLGGKRWSKEHVEETAMVLNEIEPDYIRLRSLQIPPVVPLWKRLQDGEFELLGEDEVVGEIGALIERIECHSTLKSDHVANLLMEVEGSLPEDKERMLVPINRYLALSSQEKLNFIFGRRSGWYEKLADLQDAYRHERVEQTIQRLRSEGGGEVGGVISRLKERFI